MNRSISIAAADRVFQAEEAAKAGLAKILTVSPKTAELAPVYGNAEKLEAALALAKAGKPICYVVDIDNAWRVQRAAMVTLGLTSTKDKVPSVVTVVKTPADMSEDELNAALAEAARRKAEAAKAVNR